MLKQPGFLQGLFVRKRFKKYKGGVRDANILIMASWTPTIVLGWSGNSCSSNSTSGCLRWWWWDCHNCNSNCHNGAANPYDTANYCTNPYDSGDDNDSSVKYRQGPDHRD